MRPMRNAVAGCMRSASPAVVAVASAAVVSAASISRRVGPDVTSVTGSVVAVEVWSRQPARCIERCGAGDAWAAWLAACPFAHGGEYPA